MMFRRLCIVVSLALGVLVHGQDVGHAITQGSQLYKEKKYKEAITLLEEAIDNYSGDMQSQLVIAELWLARNYMHSWQSDEAYAHYAKAYRLSKELDNDSLAIEAGTSFVSLLSFQNRQDSLKVILDELLEYKSLKYYEQSNLFNMLAGYYEDKEQIDSAVHYQLKSAAIDSVHQDSSSIPYTYYDLGNFYVANFQYKEGISKILYGLKFIRGERDLYKRNTIELGLSNIYLKIRNIERAQELAEKVYLSAKENKQQINLTNAYNALGNCAAFQQEYRQALDFYEQSDSVNAASTKNIWREIRAKTSIIEQKLNLGLPIKNSDLLFLSKIDKKDSNNYLHSRIDLLKLRLGNYILSDFNKEYERLYSLYDASENMGMKLRFLEVKRHYLKQKGRYREALEVEDEIKSIEKKIAIQNNEYIVQDLEAKYERKVQDERIENLNQQNTIKSKLLTQQKKTIWIGGVALGLISLLSFLLLRLYRQVKSQKNVISKALTEKDLLLREIHHRVKNNLQLVSSLLTLQGRSIDDEMAQQAIQAGQSRVRSMALIHQDLYNKESLTDVGVKEYVEKLTHELFTTYRIDIDKVSLTMQVDDIDLDIDTLVPLGLIINELLTNSLKYAFPEEAEGNVTVALTEGDSRIKLKVADDGVGYDPMQVRQNSFGSSLISALVEQLEGTVDLSTDQGTSIEISIPNT